MRPASDQEGDIIIYVRGGCVQDVISNREGLRAMLVDYDNEEEETDPKREFCRVRCDPKYFSKTLAHKELPPRRAPASRGLISLIVETK